MRIPVGPKQAEQASKWLSSAVGYGAAASLIGLYLTDWRCIVTYIPFYGGKFKSEE